MVVALAAAAARHLVFEGRRRAHGLDGRLDRLLRQKRAAEVGVQHGAGEIEDAPLRRLQEMRELRLAPAQAGPLVGDIRAAALGSRPAAQRFDDQTTAGTVDQGLQGGPASHSIDGGRAEDGLTLNLVGTRHCLLLPEMVDDRLAQRARSSNAGTSRRTLPHEGEGSEVVMDPRTKGLGTRAKPSSPTRTSSPNEARSSAI